MSNHDSVDSTEALQDGVIVNTVLRNLSENLNREFEEERVLNGPLSMVCTYPEGYLERQSLYSCLTCQKETGQLAGICYACSENCHPDHDLIQLYTKRNFACDCGNSKFKQKCTLFEEKLAVNRKNKYNHNFKDEYCTCNKPYPAPEDDPLHDSEMYQCSMCEDWFHPVHIGVEKVESDDFSEMVCPECSTKFPFLSAYHFVYEQDVERNENTLNETGQAESSVPPPSSNAPAAAADLNAAAASSSVAAKPSAEQNTTPRPPPVNNTNTSDPSDCYYDKIKQIMPAELMNAPRTLVFYSVDWRPMLCRCTKCKSMYEDLECEFLLDENDSVYQYLQKNANELEKNRRDPRTELFEEVALRTNVDVAHSVVTEIDTFKHDLTSFIKNVGETKKEVTADDVYAFFDELKAKRRRLHDPNNDDSPV